MNSSIPLMLCIAIFGGLAIAQYLLGPIADQRARLLAAPGLLAMVWTLALQAIGSLAIPLHQAWTYFWIASAACTILGGTAFFRHYRVSDLTVFIVPACAALFVMMPFVVHGLGIYPGSSFWDGYWYLAIGETIWRYPRGENLQDVGLIYQLGSAWQGRFISAAFIAIFQSALPFGGDSQASIGYFLLFSIFVLSCSCFALARILFASTGRRLAVVLLATASGFVVTPLHANNFDQLLAVSILPVIIALAFWVRWSDVRSAAALGTAGVASVLIYWELAPVLLTAPALVLLYKWIDERPTTWAFLATAGITLLVMAVGILSFLPMLRIYFASELTAVLAIGVYRPGDGYFPTFFAPKCAAGAFFMLYEPFLQCGWGVKPWVTGAVGVIGLVLLAAGTINARGRLVPVAGFSCLTILLAALALIWRRYDYAAYKMLSPGYPAFAALVVNGAISARSWWAMGASWLTASAYAVLICLRLVSLDGTAKYKTVEEFRGMLAYVPPSSIVVVKIQDYLAFEWAAYYLRDRLMVPLVGRLLYLPVRPLTSAQQNLLPHAQFLVTDMQDDDCWGAPVWSSTAYRLFAIKQPTVNFDCGSLKPPTQ